MKSGKRHMTEGVEIPNQVVIRTLWEKVTYKLLGILEAGTIKQEEMKEKKIKKSISEVWENYRRQKYIARRVSISCPPFKILGTILEEDLRRI